MAGLERTVQIQPKMGIIIRGYLGNATWKLRSSSRKQSETVRERPLDDVEAEPGPEPLSVLLPDRAAYPIRSIGDHMVAKYRVEQCATEDYEFYLEFGMGPKVHWAARDLAAWVSDTAVPCG
jgi:hypothetical protein